MIKSLVAAGLVTAALLSQASAKDMPIVYCNMHNLNMIHNEAAKMTAPSQMHAMEMTMKELDMAMKAHAANDIPTCRMHAGMAMEDMHAK